MFDPEKGLPDVLAISSSVETCILVLLALANSISEMQPEKHPWVIYCPNEFIRKEQKLQT